jgi:hypothetical protein
MVPPVKRAMAPIRRPGYSTKVAKVPTNEVTSHDSGGQAGTCGDVSRQRRDKREHAMTCHDTWEYEVTCHDSGATSGSTR